jgi:hypothetical protein
MEIIFKTQRVRIEGEFNNCLTAKRIYERLPIEARASTWGEEIYFEIPVRCKPENATQDVEIGDIAYWPEGRCLCIFFGRTPVSRNEKPKPASEVNIVGKIIGDISTLKNIKSGDKIRVMKRGG